MTDLDIIFVHNTPQCNSEKIYIIISMAEHHGTTFLETILKEIHLDK